jgi:hypothetical protein
VGKKVGDMSERNAAENLKPYRSDARGGQFKVGGTIVHRNPQIWRNKTTRIMMATVPHVTSSSGLEADGFLFDRA